MHVSSWLRKQKLMQSNSQTTIDCPFDPNLCIFPDHFCSLWQECKKCFQKFAYLLNVNRNSDIGAIAPTGWEANSEECKEVNASLSERRFQDMSTQVATQELTKVEDTKVIIKKVKNLKKK